MDTRTQAAGAQTGSRGQGQDPVVEMLKSLKPEAAAAFRSKSSLEGAPIEATIAAYRQMQAAASELAAKAKKIQRSPILLQVSDDLSELAELKLFERRCAQLEGRLDEAIDLARRVPRPGRLGPAFLPPAVIAAVPALIGIAAQLLTTESTEAHGPVTIDERALVAAVGKACRSAGIKALTPTEVSLLDPPAHGLQQRLETLEKKGDTLRALIAGLESGTPPAGDADGAAADAPDSAAAGEGSGQPPSKEAAKAYGEAVLKLVDAFLGGFPGIAGRLYRADAMRHALGTNGLVLAVRMLAATGGMQTVTGAWGSLKSRHAIGGVVVAYAFIDRDGTVLDTIADVECSGLIMKSGQEPVLA